MNRSDALWEAVQTHLDARRDPLADEDVLRMCADDPESALEVIQLLERLDGTSSDADIPRPGGDRKPVALAAERPSRLRVASAAALAAFALAAAGFFAFWMFPPSDAPQAPGEDDLEHPIAAAADARTPRPRILAWHTTLTQHTGSSSRAWHRDASGSTRSVRGTPSSSAPSTHAVGEPNQATPRILTFDARITTVTPRAEHPLTTSESP